MTGGTTTHATINLGSYVAGQTVTVSFAIQNTGGASATLLSGALETAINGAAISNPGLSGSGVTAQNFGPIAGAAQSSTYTITFNTGDASN